jgi:hypothetical protein
MVQQKIDSGLIGYGLATLGLFVGCFSLLSLWGAEGKELVVFSLLTMFSVVLVIVGIKMTTSVSEKFIGIVYVLLGILFSVMMVTLIHADVTAMLHGDMLPSSHSGQMYLALPLGPFLLALGLAKISGRNVQGIDRTKLSAPRSGSFSKNFIDFLEMILIAIAVFVVFIGGIWYFAVHFS